MPKIDPVKELTVREVQIMTAVDESAGNMAKAAKALGISRSAVHRAMARIQRKLNA